MLENELIAVPGAIGKDCTVNVLVAKGRVELLVIAG